MSEGKFKVCNIVNFHEINEETILPESDLTIQTDDRLIQFSYDDEDEEDDKVVIKTGCYSISSSSLGTKLVHFKLRDYHLLKSIDNTKVILDEANKFFSKLDIYESLKREPKRAILLCSAPGCGKSSAINEVCKSFLKEEGTTVLLWDTSSISSQAVSKLFLTGSEFDPKVKKLILVIEDIGGGSIDNYGEGPTATDSSLLNLLDGVGSPFKNIPTFIISTTNNPETSVEALVDRPGRFDKLLELKSPDSQECIDLLKFIKEVDTLTDDELKSAELAAQNKFSIAHVQEIIVRSLLDDISILQATEQLILHKKRFKNSFKKPVKGLGLNS